MRLCRRSRFGRREELVKAGLNPIQHGHNRQGRVRTPLGKGLCLAHLPRRGS